MFLHTLYTTAYISNVLYLQKLIIFVLIIYFYELSSFITINFSITVGTRYMFGVSWVYRLVDIDPPTFIAGLWKPRRTTDCHDNPYRKHRTQNIIIIIVITIEHLCDILANKCVGVWKFPSPFVVLNSPKYIHPSHYVQRIQETSAAVLSKNVCQLLAPNCTQTKKNVQSEIEKLLLTREGAWD